MDVYNEWAVEYNAQLPQTKNYWQKFVPHKSSKKFQNDNNTNNNSHTVVTSPKLTNNYKLLVLLRVLFEGGAVMKKWLTISDYLKAKGIEVSAYGWSGPKDPPGHDSPNFKGVFVGDGATGKTCLCIQLSTGQYPSMFFGRFQLTLSELCTNCM